MRLFVAVNLPPEMRDALWQTTAALRAAPYPVRWVAADALHVTVKFLGDVDPLPDAALRAALGRAAAGVKPFSLGVSGFGAFPSAHRPRVVWAGCAHLPAFELLQHGVERECAALGFPLEQRPFHPHVTLGRVKREARPAAFRSLPEDLERLVFEASAPVASLDLMESTLMPGGARYTVRHVVELVS